MSTKAASVKAMSVTKDQSVVEGKALEACPSPLLTSSLFSRNSATSAEESAYLSRATTLKSLRLALSVLVICAATTTAACAGHVLHSYNQTQLGPEWFLPLWPSEVDIRPTLGTLIPATVVIVTSVLYIVFAIVPSPRARTLHQVVLFLITSSVALIATLFSVLFYQIILYHSDVDERDTLQSWTCKLYNGAKDYEYNAASVRIDIDGSDMVPDGFQRMCMENKTGQGMMIGLLLVLIICCIVSVLGLVAEKKIEKSRANRYHREEKFESELMSP